MLKGTNRDHESCRLAVSDLCVLSVEWGLNSKATREMFVSTSAGCATKSKRGGSRVSE